MSSRVPIQPVVAMLDAAEASLRAATAMAPAFTAPTEDEARTIAAAIDRLSDLLADLHITLVGEVESVPEEVSSLGDTPSLADADFVSIRDADPVAEPPAELASASEYETDDDGPDWAAYDDDGLHDDPDQGWSDTDRTAMSISGFDDGASFISFGPPPPDGAPPRHAPNILDDEDDVPDYLKPAPAADEDEDEDEDDERDKADEPGDRSQGAPADATLIDEDEHTWGVVEPPPAPESTPEGPDSEWASYADPAPPGGVAKASLYRHAGEVTEAPLDDGRQDARPAVAMPGSAPAPWLPPSATFDEDDETDDRTQVVPRASALASLRAAPSVEMGGNRLPGRTPQFTMGNPPSDPDDDFDDDFDDRTQVMARPAGFGAAIKLGADGPQVLGQAESDFIALGDTADYGDDDAMDDGTGVLGVGVFEYSDDNDDDDEQGAATDVATAPSAAPVTDSSLTAMLAEAEATQRRDIAAGEALWGDILDADPGRVESYLERGRLRVDLGDFVGAASDLQRAEGFSPRNPEIQVALGELFYSRKDYTKAVLYLDKALDLTPNHATALARRGMTFYFRRQYGQAVKDFEKALSVDPRQTHLNTYLERARKQT